MLGFSKVLPDNGGNHRHVSFGTQVSMLIHRDFVNMARNKKAMRARFALTIMMSILEGIIFLRVGSRSLSQFTVSLSHSSDYSIPLSTIENFIIILFLNRMSRVTSQQ
jgi:hypothetical protein